jgi:hypothetical protein
MKFNIDYRERSAGLSMVKLIFYGDVNEKGGYCKQARKKRSPENCLQLPKAKE